LLDTLADCSFLVRGWRRNGCCAWSYCSSVTSFNNDTSITLDHNTVRALLSDSPLKKPIRLSLLYKWKQVVTWHEANHSPNLPRIILVFCRCRWPRGLRRRAEAARLLRLWVRILPGAWKFVSCECCVLSGRGLCNRPITRPEESYRLWCVVVCDLETSWMSRPWPAAPRENKMLVFGKST